MSGYQVPALSLSSSRAKKNIPTKDYSQQDPKNNEYYRNNMNNMNNMSNMPKEENSKGSRVNMFPPRNPQQHQQL